MNRCEERMIWACVIGLYQLHDLEFLMLESIEYLQKKMPARDIPRLASPEGMAETAAILFADIKQGRRPLLAGSRSLNREHLSALKSMRFSIASEVLRRLPTDKLTSRILEIRFSGDTGS